MANFIELTTAQGPRAINIDHIRSFTGTATGTRIAYKGSSEQDEVLENYETVRAMLSVTTAPQPALANASAEMLP